MDITVTASEMQKKSKADLASDEAASFLTDSLTGVLKSEDDLECAKTERLGKKYEFREGKKPI